VKKRLIILTMIIASALLAGCGTEFADDSPEIVDVSTDTEGTDANDDTGKTPAMDENWIDLKLEASDDNEAWNFQNVVDEFEIPEELKSELENDSVKELEFEDILEVIDFTGEGKGTEVFKLAETRAGNEDDYEVYKVYITNTASIIIETPDNSYIGLDNVAIIDFIRGEVAHFRSYDFDGDDKAELLIEASNLHGTEYTQETIFVVDKDDNGQWKVFHLTPDWLIAQIDTRVDIMYSSTHMRYVVDGSEAYLKQRDNMGELSLSMDSNLYYENRGESLIASVGPAFRQENQPGIFTAPIQVSISYEGAGQWTMSDLVVTHGTLEDYSDVIDTIGKERYYALWDNSSFDRAFLLVTDKEDDELWSLRANGRIVSDRCEVYGVVAGKPVKIGEVEAQGLGTLAFTKDGCLAAGYSHELSEYDLNGTRTAVILKTVYCDDAIALNGVVGPAKYDGNETKRIELQEYQQVCQTYGASSQIEFTTVK